MDSVIDNGVAIDSSFLSVSKDLVKIKMFDVINCIVLMCGIMRVAFP